MALIIKERVQQIATANTTVSFTLTANVPSFQGFDSIGNGNTTYYAAVDSSGSWEVGIATYTTAGPTLTRNTILESSNSDNRVTFSGAVAVFVTYPAAEASTAVTQAAIATAKAAEALASAATATTKAGEASASASTATTKASEASTSASTATTQANTATTQAGIATTQAGIATTQAGIATTKANVVAQSLASYPYKPSVNPTISSDFANQEHKIYEIPYGLTEKPLADIWTVTRASTGGYTDPTGLYRTASANTPRITYDILGRASLLVEEARTRLNTYPRNFENAVYNKDKTAVLPYNITNFDGTLSACKVIENQTTASTTYGIFIPVTGVSGTTYTCTVIAKAGERYAFDFRTPSAIFGTVYRYTVNLTAGTITAIMPSPLGATITNLGNGYYAATITATATASATSQYAIYLNEGDTTVGHTGVIGSGLYLGYVQTEAGASATSIIPDDTIFVSRASTATFIGSNGLLQTAAINTERLSYNPANLNAEPVKLYEEARTNEVLNADDFNNASWLKTNTTSSPPAVYGATTATRILETATTAPHQVSATGGATVIGQNYTWSVWVKGGLGRDRAFLTIDGAAFGGVTQQALFDITTGLITNISGTIATSIEDWGDGVYKLSLTTVPATATTAVGRRFYLMDSGVLAAYVGDITKGMYLVRAQYEAGAYPTSYIPTVASAVTRAADVTTGVQATRAVNVVSRLLGKEFNKTSFSMYIDMNFFDVSQTIGTRGSVMRLATSLTSGDGIEVSRRAGNPNLYIRYAQGSQIYANFSTAPYSLNGNKIILSYNLGVIKLYLNGVLLVTTTQFLLTSPINVLTIMTDGFYKSTGQVRDFKYYPKALTDAEAILLTS